MKAQVFKEGTPPVIYGNGSFYDWAQHWLENLVRPRIKPGTYAEYWHNLHKHIYPLLGDYPIREITPDEIQNMVNILKQQVAGSTLHGICRLLKSVLTCACQYEVIRSNPYRDIKLPKAKQRPPRVLTCKEQKYLEQEILSRGHLEYLLGLYAGLRVGEICGLRWENIDFERSLLYVCSSVQRIPKEKNIHETQVIVGTPKSASSVREIPLPTFLTGLLAERKKHADLSDEDFIFPGKYGRYQEPRLMQQRLTKLCEDLQIQGVHMHTLRHTFATRCLENGTGYEVLCEFLGHSSPQITLRYYAHCTFETKRKIIEKLSLAVDNENI